MKAAPTTSWPRRVVLLGALTLAAAIPVVGHVAAAMRGVNSLVAFIDVAAILGLTAATVGLVILWRRPGNVIGACLLVGALLLMSVFTSFAIALLRGSLPDPADAAASATFDASDTAGLVALWWGSVVANPAIFLLFPAVGILFPNGHLPGPRWRLPFFGIVAMIVVSGVIQTITPWASPSSGLHEPNPFAVSGVPYELHNLGVALGQFALLLAFGLAVVAVTVRFRGSRGVERAQLKWLVASVAVMAVAFVISDATDSWAAADLLDQIAFLLGSIIPIAIGVAILRYRLFDIDRIVSRTIGYAVVTGLLLAAYLTAILVFQTVIKPITGENALAVAASTLMVAALFQPVRRRVQGVVDRRFDRARVDADRTSVAFRERLRNEVDIETVSTDLRATVQSSIHPSALGLWLRESG